MIVLLLLLPPLLLVLGCMQLKSAYACFVNADYPAMDKLRHLLWAGICLSGCFVTAYMSYLLIEIPGK